MDSPLVRVILAILGGYLIILLLMSVYDWISKEFPSRPNIPPTAERIQHPFYHEEAIRAIEWFARLPISEKNTIKESINSNLVSLGQWLTDLNQSNFRILCIGELHEESTRNFLAEEFFKKARIDTLMLETTPIELNRLIKKMEDSRDYFPLLSADIMRILRAAIERNPDIEIRGIEETKIQQKGQGSKSNSRDHFIANNFWNSYQAGNRHIILFGALHCTNESNWLFHNLRSQAPLQIKNRMLNVAVLGEHQNGPLEAFVYFLDEIGMEKRHFVISDTSLLHSLICEFFQLLKRQTLDKYQSVIVFRS